MKILFLEAYHYPEITADYYLSDNLYEALIGAGHEIEIHTPCPTRGVSREERRRYRKIRTERLHDGKMIVHRFPMFREGKNPVSRALRYILCSTIQCWYGIRSRQPDILFITSTPPIQGAMGGIVSRIRRLPLVYNLQDIFPDSLVGTGLAAKDSIWWKIGRVIERFTYRHADRIIVISEGFKQNILAKGVPEKKIDVIYNWVDEEAVVPVLRERNGLFDRYRLDRNHFYVTYCGNIGLTQNMDMLLDAARELMPIEDLRFVLVGQGACLDAVEKRIREENIRNVTLLPFQPYEVISEVFSLGDVGLVISKPGVGENSVPSKTWSILSAGRPIVASFDENELKQIIEKHDTGIFTRAGDRKQFTEAVLALYRDRERCERCGRNGREFILQNLTKRAGTAAYLDVIERCAREAANSAKK